LNIAGRLFRPACPNVPCPDQECRASSKMNKTPNPIDKHVGARVKLRRLTVGMSQSKLGEALNITFQQIQKYEKGLNRIGASRLQELARAMSVPPSFFFEGAPTSAASTAGFAEPESGGDVTEFLSTAEGLQLNRSFALIRDAKVRRRIIDLVSSLAQQ
jgi:transcriptional regulator with XRE-family HTH domain